MTITKKERTMEKAPSKIALNSLLFFLVVAGVSLFSMLPGGAETILVKRCSTNDDCKAFGWDHTTK